MRLLCTALMAGALLFPATAQDAKSLSCALLTKAEAADILGHSVMNGDDTAETGGASSCAWVDEENFNAISIQMERGEALQGGSADAAFAAQKTALANAGTVEDLADFGVPAFVLTATGAPAETFTAIFAKGGALIIINVTGVPKNKTIAAAKIVAGRL
ncbi:hypothetical protein sos41_05500 [Alphaproteobacteria bacterium SO-S41]|nr:hypothetical protein sos41_05500 [Alphaproteobacteria bacterium SO-S41]